jgi:phosphonate transport system substrate-binding protein
VRNLVPGYKWTAIFTALLLCLSIPPSLANSFDALSGTERVVFRIGYPASAFNRGIMDEVRVALEVWGSKLAERGTQTIKQVITTIFEDEDFSELYNALKRKEIDCLIMNTLDYIAFERDELMEPVFVGFSGEDIGHEYVLLVRHDSGIDSLDKLENGTINIETEGVGRMPIIWLDVVLARAALPNMSSFFKEIHFLEKASQAVLPVFFGKVTAGITNMRAYRTMVELNPQLERELVMLRSSPPFLRGVVVFRKDLAQNVKESVSETLQTLHEDPDGQQILIVMREEKLIPYKPEYTNTVRILHKEYNRRFPDKKTDNSEDK